MDKWKELEQQLGGIFGCARLRAEGHEVILQKRLDGEKLVIQVGVDGWIKGAWSMVDDQGEPKHPEGRFYRPMRSRAWPLKQYKELRKVFGKRKADEMTALRTAAVSPYWNSPRTLISHLKKRFPDLDLLPRDEVV
ncbi:hypothetical protein QWY79_03515 [Halomonas sabkhae]|uniref:hypothetical protein n=1 Tax=Halomonas sabkhae TaxID=626223 RepID=UPI0025B32860|nr:hypothetical protein [Halomonas sabkhae]MDN3524330.1 hypothetical protein [Halomonas sabkhae]